MGKALAIPPLWSRKTPLMPNYPGWLKRQPSKLSHSKCTTVGLLLVEQHNYTQVSKNPKKTNTHRREEMHHSLIKSTDSIDPRKFWHSSVTRQVQKYTRVPYSYDCLQTYRKWPPSYPIAPTLLGSKRKGDLVSCHHIFSQCLTKELF